MWLYFIFLLCVFILYKLKSIFFFFESSSNIFEFIHLWFSVKRLFQWNFSFNLAKIQRLMAKIYSFLFLLQSLLDKENIFREIPLQQLRLFHTFWKWEIQSVSWKKSPVIYQLCHPSSLDRWNTRLFRKIKLFSLIP